MALQISRILHAGYIFECDQIRIAFDPILESPFSRNCHAFPEIEFDYSKVRQLKLDAVFISHHHDDHCSLESLQYLDRQTPIYLYCIHEELFLLIRTLGFQQVYSLQINETVDFGAIRVTPKRALDADVDSIFHIEAAGLNILNVVDSWIDDEVLSELSKIKWSLILWPFQTMREIEVLSPSRASPAPKHLPPEWIEQLTALNPQYVIPSSCQFLQESWSWYNHAFFPVTYKQFQSEIEASLPHAKVIRLNPGVSIEFNNGKLQFSSPLSWIKTVGPQDVDYEYKIDIIPATTAEIAKKFPPLTSAQLQQVHEYCTDGILEKYNSLETTEEKYFRKPRCWQLTLYNVKGEARSFIYEINGRQLKSVVNSEIPLAWTTEVPAAKLYAALENGESLTSMYMRINDQVFAPEIEQEMAEIDLIEDPLIRCLFSGSFGAYQRFQLKKILMDSNADI